MTVSDAVLPDPPSVDVTVRQVLFFTPAVVPVTVTAKVHGVLAVTVAPLRGD